MSFPTSSSGIPVLSKYELEYLAEEHTKAFSRYEGKENSGFSAWKFAAYYLGKKVRFEWLSNDGCVLGLSSFVDGTRIPVYDPDKQTVNWQDLGPDTILLSKTLEHLELEPGKPRFTLMHECAHHLLHKGYFQRKAASGSEKAVAYSIQRDQDRVLTQENRAWTDEDRIEWQANYLASALLMPESRVNRVLIEKGYQEDYFKHVLAGLSEVTVYQQLVSRLACTFRVSTTTAKIRLEAVGFERLPDLQVRKPNPWNQYWPDQPKIRMTRRDQALLHREPDRHCWL